MEEVKHEVRETSRAVHGIDDHGFNTVNQYSIIKKLGQGSFGKVKLCKFGDQHFAVKVYNKAFLRRKRDLSAPFQLVPGQNSALQAVLREIALMKKFHHQNVLNLFEVIDDEDAEKIYMVMDYCEKGPIMEWEINSRRFYFPWNEGHITEEQLRKIFRDIVCGLEYLHFHNIIHRDIKPQNILLNSDWVIKIGDFGQAQMFAESDMQRSTIGTYFFFPPESCCAEAHEFSGKAADIWALGITLYALIYHKLPFWADSLSEIFEVIQNFVLEFPTDIEVPEDLKHLLVRLLDKNPNTRIKMFELLQDPWLNKNCNPLSPPVHSKLTVSEEEISQALKPLRALVYAVRIN